MSAAPWNVGKPVETNVDSLKAVLTGPVTL